MLKQPCHIYFGSWGGVILGTSVCYRSFCRSFMYEKENLAYNLFFFFPLLIMMLQLQWALQKTCYVLVMELAIGY